jgi:hypothetical protein
VIIGYSAANFISSSNQVTKSTLVPGVQMGNISSIVPNDDPNRLPWVGTAPNLTPNTAYYANATFGRDVYNVFDASLFDPLFPSANADVKTLFGVGGAVCASAAQITRAVFGFGESVLPCGNATLTSGLESGSV